MAEGQVRRAGRSALAMTAKGGLCCSGRIARVALELSAGPMPPAEHSGQPKAWDRVGSLPSGVLDEAGAWVAGSTVQNWPPRPLSCAPTICP
ncbi:hypothetical protein D3C85_1256830 [compost metagenome]